MFSLEAKHVDGGVADAGGGKVTLLSRECARADTPWPGAEGEKRKYCVQEQQEGLIRLDRNKERQQPRKRSSPSASDACKTRMLVQCEFVCHQALLAWSL